MERSFRLPVSDSSGIEGRRRQVAKDDRRSPPERNEGQSYRRRNNDSSLPWLLDDIRGIAPWI